MTHVKILGLVAVAMMAFAASSASATELYNGATTLKSGTVLDFSATSFPFRLTNTQGTETLDECTGSTIKGTTTNNGSAGVAVQSNITELTWTGCSVPTSTDTLGGLEVAWTAGTEGTVKANAEIGVTINTIFFGLCTYGFEKGNHVGTIKSSAAGTATFTENATARKLTPSNFACPETARWIATYTSTSPDNLRVENS
jgi:hypothetical protein